MDVRNLTNINNEILRVASGMEAIKTIGFEIIRPNDTTGYAAGDVVSSSDSVFSLIEFNNAAKQPGAGCLLSNMRLQVNNAGTGAAILGKRFRLYLYNKAIPTDTIYDNIPYVMIYSNSAFRIGYVDFTLPSAPDATSATVATQVDGINKVFQLVGTTLYGRLMSLDSFNPIANTRFYLQAHLIQTN